MARWDNEVALEAPDRLCITKLLPRSGTQQSSYRRSLSGKVFWSIAKHSSQADWPGGFRWRLEKLRSNSHQARSFGLDLAR